MSSSSSNIVAIVPAAGVGRRMQQKLPKQYLPLHGKTILEHTLTALLTHPAVARVIVAVGADDPYIQTLPIMQQSCITTVIGGNERSDSVWAALNEVEDDDWVMVHDAARPCVTHTDIDKLLAYQTEEGAILACPVTDTIKRSNAQQSIEGTEDRSQLWHAMTPQFFRADILKKAFQYAQEKNVALTDEASTMELIGLKPHLVVGRADNIKVTRPEDLALAEFYLQSHSNKVENS